MVEKFFLISELDFLYFKIYTYCLLSCHLWEESDCLLYSPIVYVYTVVDVSIMKWYQKPHWRQDLFMQSKPEPGQGDSGVTFSWPEAQLQWHQVSPASNAIWDSVWKCWWVLGCNEALEESELCVFSWEWGNVVLKLPQLRSGAAVRSCFWTKNSTVCVNNSCTCLF